VFENKKRTVCLADLDEILRNLPALLASYQPEAAESAARRAGDMAKAPPRRYPSRQAVEPDGYRPDQEDGPAETPCRHGLLTRQKPFQENNIVVIAI